MKRNDLTPEEAAELFIADKQSDGLAERTIDTYRQHLRYVLTWLHGRETPAETVRDVDGLTLTQYKADNPHYASKTLHNRLRTCREMLRWAASVGAHDRETVEAIELTRPQDARSSEVTREEAERILDRLAKYRYASRDHVLMVLLWRTGIRLGTAHSLDVCDVDYDAPALTAAHRPPETTLKNKEGGERPIALAEPTAAVIDDYTDHNRHDVTSGPGREPLLTTEHGRATRHTLRYAVYAVTRPCWYGAECPEGRDPEECDAAGSKRGSAGCPDNNSPHDVRRGRLTDYRRGDVPKHVISDRCDVSIPVLEQHYNTMTESEKMEQRREYL